jgi:hypothetical protein
MCDTEVYTVRVDSVYATSNTSFIGYFNIPLRNVIKAELLSASFHANSISPVTTFAYYITIEELKSKFTDRTNIQYSQSVGGQQGTTGPALTSSLSNVGQLSSSMVCIPLDDIVTTSHRTMFLTNNYFPVEIPFIEPIRILDKLTVNFYTAIGAQWEFPGSSYLTLKFTCAKPNACLYP